MESSPTALNEGRRRLAELLVIFPELEALDRDAFVVGGALRDLAFGMTPADFDVAAFGALEKARRYAASVEGRLVDMGRDRFTTYRVVTGRRAIDFTEIEHDLARDLARRDCTIDAMALEVGTGALFDPHDGRGDIARRSLRMISEQNFIDDPLRILKLVRLAVTHDCSIEPETFDAMRRHADKLSSIAVERARSEAELILEHTRARLGVELIADLSLGGIIFGTNLDDRHRERLTPLLEADFVTRLCAVVFDTNQAVVKKRLETLRWSDAITRAVLSVAQAARVIIDGKIDRRIAFFDAGERNGDRVVMLLGALGEHQKSIDAAELLSARPDLFTTQTFLTGVEIQNIARVKPGPRLGVLKRALLEAQLVDEVKTRSEAEAWIEKRR